MNPTVFRNPWAKLWGDSLPQLLAVARWGRPVGRTRQPWLGLQPVGVNLLVEAYLSPLDFGTLETENLAAILAERGYQREMGRAEQPITIGELVVSWPPDWRMGHPRKKSPVQGTKRARCDVSCPYRRKRRPIGALRQNRNGGGSGIPDLRGRSRPGSETRIACIRKSSALRRMPHTELLPDSICCAAKPRWHDLRARYGSLCRHTRSRSTSF